MNRYDGDDFPEPHMSHPDDENQGRGAWNRPSRPHKPFKLGWVLSVPVVAFWLIVAACAAAFGRAWW